eukprot:gene22644-28783_t
MWWPKVIGCATCMWVKPAVQARKTTRKRSYSESSAEEGLGQECKDPVLMTSSKSLQPQSQSQQSQRPQQQQQQGWSSDGIERYEDSRHQRDESRNGEEGRGRDRAQASNQSSIPRFDRRSRETMVTTSNRNDAARQSPAQLDCLNQSISHKRDRAQVESGERRGDDRVNREVVDSEDESVAVSPFRKARRTAAEKTASSLVIDLCDDEEERPPSAQERAVQIREQVRTNTANRRKAAEALALDADSGAPSFAVKSSPDQPTTRMQSRQLQKQQAEASAALNAAPVTVVLSRAPAVIVPVVVPVVLLQSGSSKAKHAWHDTRESPAAVTPVIPVLNRTSGQKGIAKLPVPVIASKSASEPKVVLDARAAAVAKLNANRPPVVVTKPPPSHRVSTDRAPLDCLKSDGNPPTQAPVCAPVSAQSTRLPQTVPRPPAATQPAVGPAPLQCFQPDYVAQKGKKTSQTTAQPTPGPVARGIGPADINNKRKRDEGSVSSQEWARQKPQQGVVPNSASQGRVARKDLQAHLTDVSNMACVIQGLVKKVETQNAEIALLRAVPPIRTPHLMNTSVSYRSPMGFSDIPLPFPSSLPMLPPSSAYSYPTTQTQSFTLRTPMFTASSSSNHRSVSPPLTMRSVRPRVEDWSDDFDTAFPALYFDMDNNSWT